MKRIQVPNPVPIACAIGTPNCVNSITPIATETTAMQKSTNPSRGADPVFASGISSDFAACSPAGAPDVGDAAEGFDSSCLLIVFYAANRFVSD
jgi:hypothetical protein